MNASSQTATASAIVRPRFRNPGPRRARLLIVHASDGGFSAMVRATC